MGRCFAAPLGILWEFLSCFARQLGFQSSDIVISGCDVGPEREFNFKRKSATLFLNILDKALSPVCKQLYVDFVIYDRG